MKSSFFKALGELSPDLFKSTYIIPFEHKFYDGSNESILNSNGWSVKNSDAKKELYLNDIKKYFIDTFFPKQCDFVKEKKAVFLRNTNFKYINLHTEDKIFKLKLDFIDLWILDDDIALFSIHISNDENTSYSIDNYSSIINRKMRDYKSLSALKNGDVLDVYDKKQTDKKDFIDVLFELTKTDNKSFLNIKEISQTSLISELTYYAKMITSVYVDKKHIEIDGKSVDIRDSRDNLLETSFMDFNYFDELAYMLATTSCFDDSKEPLFKSHRRYVYEILQNNSINIWDNWVGIGLQDSCAFFSIKDGGKNIVCSNSTTNYFLYVVNFVTNIKLKIYEHQVIDEDFIEVAKIYKLKQKMQKLKNQFITSEVSIKFQPSAIYKKMEIGFKNKEILDEISTNIDMTFDITKQNTDILISFGTILFALSSFKEPIIKSFDKDPFGTIFWGVLILIVIVSLLPLFIHKGMYILKKIKHFLRF